MRALIGPLFLVALLSQTEVAAEPLMPAVPANQSTVAKLRGLIALKKGEFEKSGDFVKRLCSETHKALGIAENAKIRVGVEHGEYATRANYDAEKQAFTVRVSTGTAFHRADDNYPDRFQWATSFDPHKHNSVGIFHEYNSRPSYIGKNAFGVEKEIKASDETHSVLYFPSARGWRSLEISYPVKPEPAKQIAKDLRIAVITSIQPPCFVAGKGRKRPTIDYPWDSALSEVGLIGAPKPEWILFRESTGEILKKGRFN